MSTEQIQLEEMQWRELYDSKMSWLVTSQTDFNSALEVSSNEVQTIVKNTSELLSSQATTKLDEVTENVTDNIKNIQDSIDDAWDTIREREKALTDAEDAAAKVANEYANALTNLKNAQLAFIGNSISSGASAVISMAQNVKNVNTHTAGITYDVSQAFPVVPPEQMMDVIHESIMKDEEEKFKQFQQEFQQKFPPQKGGVTKKGFYSKYAKGGIVDFSGPAWVDGTKSRPEAFLNADDTKRIGEAAKLLSDLPLLDNPRTQTNEISNTNVGDTTFEIHINVENISSDYDVDQAVERVKQDIADAAQYAGSNVILKKK